ncbi:MAG TPA: response regulator [Fibrobacteraceae bacterium]|nr:response regulator [Fibrobacteraceae bacterium]
MSATILIVDDNHLIRFTTSLLMKQVGLQSLQASSGGEGLAMAKTSKPDAILLDIMMPDMDGWEVLDALNQDPDLAKIPVILFSALDQQTFAGHDMSPSIKTILHKPFHLDQLLMALRIALPDLEV